jgi:DNA-binding response OmpR family regulator
MKRILAVDDNNDILEILRYILEDSGYTVDTLSNGHHLFDQIKQHTPDLILLDIMLGDMDGRVLCRDIKQTNETHEIPVVLISASHKMYESIARHDVGAPDDFVEKPFDMNVLLNVIENNLRPAA